jgi:hypothetical protein
LRQIEILNETPILQNAFPGSIDVVGSYSNIPTEEGIAAMRRALDTRQDKTVTTNTILEMIDHVLRLNIFELNSELHIQNVGTALGTKVAPTMANIFTAEIDINIIEYGIIKGKNCIYFYHRFLDDIFIIWIGTKDNFSEFMKKVNLLHKTIKFVCEFDYDKKSTKFLDTKVNMDLKKDTDKVQNPLPSYCHPSHNFKGRLFS